MIARLIETREIAPEVRHFVFEAPEVERLDFTPGQFVSFTGDRNGRPITRAYSTAAPPSGNRFEICLNRVQDGAYSPFLFSMHPGDEAVFKGTYGNFVWRDPVKDSILVATGTGIAPFRSMLLDYLGRGGEREMTLIFGVRHEHALLYREEWEEMDRNRPNFHFWPTLSRPEPGWQGRTGHVQPHVFEAIGPRRDVDVYICGLKAMVDDVRAKLKDAGFDRKQIVFEKYD